MAQQLKRVHYDVVVIGGGSAGVAASVAAARNGSRTLLIDSAPMVGGELISGLPICACLSARGDWAVGGIIREIIDECDALGGIVGPYFDWRSLWLVGVDPEVMKVVVNQYVARAGVRMLLYTFAEDVVVEDGSIVGLIVLNKSQRTLVTADVFIDCSGDGDIAALAGAPSEMGGPHGELQPVTMMFRMQGVETEPLLRFVRDNPDVAALGESPALLDVPKAECAAKLYEQMIPSVFFDGKKPFLAEAMAKGELRPCGILAVCPSSPGRREVSLNTTRIPNVNAMTTEALTAALPNLLDQVMTCAKFLKNRVPGFEGSHFSGIAPRIGIRETRRILGEHVLSMDDVLQGRKFTDGVAKGCHELDVHAGTREHRREMIKDGGTYDIPFGCLVPQNVRNVMVAGRCLSASREAHGSARVMATCMAMGQAVGTAAAMCVKEETPIRQLSVAALRDRLTSQGAVLDGIV